MFQRAHHRGAGNKMSNDCHDGASNQANVTTSERAAEDGDATRTSLR